MKIIDEIYGEEEINEQVLVDLINSKPLQRLKGIAQYGIPDEYYHKKNFSRYDHSRGVFILLRILGADLKEQIAGLLHDVSHTAFSHVIDWFIGDPTKEDYQDTSHLKFIMSSDLPFILAKYGFNYQDVSRFEDFSLLDKDLPGLCADRLDYSLRELKEEIGLRALKRILSNLRVVEKQIIFSNWETAKFFAEKYMFLQREHWSGEQARARYHILSEALKIAVDRRIISMKDLLKTDAEVIHILLESKHPPILKRLNLLKKGFDVVESNEGIELKKKFRFIDPEVLFENKICPLSKVSEDYFRFIEEQKEVLQSFKKIIIVEK